jgi:hypothetical protein
MQTKLNQMFKASGLILLTGSNVFAQNFEPMEEGWKHSIEIYALALNIRGDSTIGNISTDVDVDPSFIMDHIDMGAMLHLEGIKDNRWGYYVDYSYMKLSGESNAVFGSDFNILKARLGIRQGVLEAKGFKRYLYDFGSIDYMAGIRWWDNDIDSKLYTSNELINNTNNLKIDWVDYVVGARLNIDISKKWDFYFSFDAGLSQDTDFTSSIQTGARYQLNDWSDLNIAYKSTWVDYDDKGTFAYNTASQGFLIGWAAQF